MITPVESGQNTTFQGLSTCDGTGGQSVVSVAWLRLRSRSQGSVSYRMDSANQCFVVVLCSYVGTAHYWVLQVILTVSWRACCPGVGLTTAVMFLWGTCGLFQEITYVLPVLRNCCEYRLLPNLHVCMVAWVSSGYRSLFQYGNYHHSEDFFVSPSSCAGRTSRMKSSDLFVFFQLC